MQRVVVTGLGAVTPLGVGVSHTWRRLIDGGCGVVSLGGRVENYEHQQCRVSGLVPDGKMENAGWTAAEWLSNDVCKVHVEGVLILTERTKEQRRMPTFTQYAMCAAQEALKDAAWRPEIPEEQEMTGICLGSGIGSLEEQYKTSLAFDKCGSRKVSPLFVPKLLINMAAGHISMKYGLKGPSHAVTTACTTGAHSIGDASRFIAFGDANVMLAGGAESCIHPLTFVGFERCRSLTTSFNHAPEKASRPFDAARDGFVIGEGAAVLVLESLPHALARNANIYCEVAGYGTSSDAHHITSPPINGHGAFRSMQLALKNASLPPSSVDYINAHATSTPLGDLAENRAIHTLMLGEEGKKSASQINVSSTKGAIGHLLGAAGAVEALFSILAIRHGVLPPTLNLTNLDRPSFHYNYVALEAQSRTVDVALSNSFGFGGTNASLCFKRYCG